MANISNTFYNYLKKNPGTPVIFVILDDKHKEQMFFSMKKLAEKV
jgi:hypothetical protein